MPKQVTQLDIIAANHMSQHQVLCDQIILAAVQTRHDLTPDDLLKFIDELLRRADGDESAPTSATVH